MSGSQPGATGDTGLARGPGVESLTQFLDVPATAEAAVCSTVWQQARQGWRDGSQGVRQVWGAHGSELPLLCFSFGLIHCCFSLFPCALHRLS